MSGGGSVRQRSSASGHRSANTQPGRSAPGRREEAGDGVEPALILPHAAARDAAQEPDRVRVPRIVEESPRRALLDELARVEDADAVAHLGDHAEVVGDEEDARPELLPEVRDELEHLRLDGGVEARGGLVEDEKRGVGGERHRDDHPLLHAARELMRVALHDRARVGDLHLAEHLLGPLGGLLALAPEHLEHLGDLAPDADRGVQSTTGVLVDHRDRARSDLAELRS